MTGKASSVGSMFRIFAAVGVVVASMLAATSPAGAAPPVAPGVPRNVVATAGIRKITITFGPPTSNGGSVITSYAASCTAVGGSSVNRVSGPASPLVVIGVAAGTSYTCTVSATNVAGTGPSSASTVAVTPFDKPSKPGAPRVISTASTLKVSVGIVNANGSPITSYSTTCSSPTGPTKTGTSSGRTITVSGVAVNTTYTCTVSATNGVGTSATSAVSNWASWGSITAAGGTAAMQLGDRSVGQRISVEFQPVSNVVQCGGAQLALLKPNGSAQFATGCVAFPYAFIDPQTVAIAGAWTVRLRADPGKTLTGALQAFLVTDQSGTIKPGGPAVTMAVSIPGAVSRLTFTTTGPLRVSALLDIGTFVGDCGSNLAILNSAGTVLGSVSCIGFASTFIEPVSLPSAATYTVLLDPTGPATGAAPLHLYIVTDTMGTISVGGAVVTMTVNSPGGVSRLTFSGTKNQRISATLSEGSITGSCGGAFAITKVDGTVLGSIGCVGFPTNFLPPVTLPATGTYTLLLDLQSEAQGNAQARLFNVTDTSGTITVGGSAVAMTVNSPGGMSRLTFTGTANLKISVTLSPGTITAQCGATFAVLKSDGTELGSNSCVGFSSPTLIAPIVLPANGTYTLLLGLTNDSQGSAQARIYHVVDQTGSITVGGPTVNVSVNQPGAMVMLTFQGSVNQVVNATLTQGTFAGQCGATFAILDSAGSVIASQGCVGFGSTVISPTTLPAAGTYSLQLQLADLNFGSGAARIT